MTLPRKVPCADCHHADHADASIPGKRHNDAPCFAVVAEGVPPTFCPCERYVAPRTSAELAEAYLGPEPPPWART